MNGRTLKKQYQLYIVHLFLIETFLLEQDDPLEKKNQ
jgi:hypothetical protein